MENTFIPGPDGHTTLRLRIYRPTSLTAQTPVLLWIHGGGYLIGRLKQDNESCASIVRELGWSMIAVDYWLAPKYPFPAALDDCYFALLGVASHCAQLEIDPVLQMLVYPMLDDRIMHEIPVCIRYLNDSLQQT